MSWFNKNRTPRIRGTKSEIRQIAHDLADHKITIEEIELKYDRYTVSEALKLATLLVQGIKADWLFC